MAGAWGSLSRLFFSIHAVSKYLPLAGLLHRQGLHFLSDLGFLRADSRTGSSLLLFHRHRHRDRIGDNIKDR